MQQTWNMLKTSEETSGSNFDPCHLYLILFGVMRKPETCVSGFFVIDESEHSFGQLI